MTNNTLGFRKILCADSHQDTCAFVSYLLNSFGYKVTTVNDMTSCLRLARAVNYDLYLIACQLSDGTGVELCEKLRAFDRQTPILFWSARVYERDRQRALEAGANFFLKKPCEYDAIPTIVSQLINESQQLPLISSSKNSASCESVV